VRDLSPREWPAHEGRLRTAQAHFGYRHPGDLTGDAVRTSSGGFSALGFSYWRV
jgi:hypothetical protein